MKRKPTVCTFNPHLQPLHEAQVSTIKGLTEIKGSIPCVVMAEGIGKSLHDFVDSLRCDLENGYVMNNIVIPYCDSKIKLLRDHM
jgi:hypothetical protein